MGDSLRLWLAAGGDTTSVLQPHFQLGVRGGRKHGVNKEMNGYVAVACHEKMNCRMPLLSQSSSAAYLTLCSGVYVFPVY